MVSLPVGEQWHTFSDINEKEAEEGMKEEKEEEEKKKEGTKAPASLWTGDVGVLAA